MAELSEPDIRALVRERYAAAATVIAEGAPAACGPASAGSSCCAGPLSITDAAGAEVFGGALYEAAPQDAGTRAALAASLGCGVPTAVADLHDGDVVLDLGSGAGADVLISARRVAPSGRAIGIDMTDEMLSLARENAAAAGIENVEFVHGYLEALPLADESVDVVLSNCVVNLSADKARALREAARVLRPGGRFAISDVIADPDMDVATRADMAQWTGCVAGAPDPGAVRALARVRRPRRRRDPGDPQGARLRRRGDRPRAQARRLISPGSPPRRPRRTRRASDRSRAPA